MGRKDPGLPPAAPEPEKPRTEKPRGPGLSPWRLESPLLPSASPGTSAAEPQDTSRGEAGGPCRSSQDTSCREQGPFSGRRVLLIEAAP